MRRRITMLIMAAMLALTMAIGGSGAAFADPDCSKVPNNKNCVVEGPGNSENSGGQAQNNNPNIETEFKPGQNR